MELKFRIEKLLSITKMSKYKLAQKANLPQSTLANILNGRNKTTSNEIVEKIATAFNITVSELLGEEEPELLDLENCYIEVAREAQDNKIDPKDLLALIEILKKEKKKK